MNEGSPPSPKPGLAAVNSLNRSRYKWHSPKLCNESIDTLRSSFIMTSHATNSSRTNLKYFTFHPYGWRTRRICYQKGHCNVFTIPGFSSQYKG
uniref:Uncharacterized protein n=1 Tax=Rhizophora mucronata TaxID=61149 RepID=A0A2P2JE33_RHIMU